MDYGCLVPWKHKHVVCLVFQGCWQLSFYMFQEYQINELSKHKCYIVNIFHLHTHEFFGGWVCVRMLWGHWTQPLKDQHYFTCTHWIQATPNSECWNTFPNYIPMLHVHKTILRIPCPLYLIIHIDAHTLTYKEFNVRFKGM